MLKMYVSVCSEDKNYVNKHKPWHFAIVISDSMNGNCLNNHAFV